MISCSTLRVKDGDNFSNPTLYKSIIGALQYVTITRLDIAFFVNKVCHYIILPKDPYLIVVKIILHYLNGTIDHGLELKPSTSLHINGFSD